MTDKEKAREIGDNESNIAKFQSECTSIKLYQGACQMAEWKNKEFSKRIEELFPHGIEIDGSFWNIQELKDFLLNG